MSEFLGITLLRSSARMTAVRGSELELQQQYVRKEVLQGIAPRCMARRVYQ